MSFCPAFQTEGKLYLILEFLRGGDLFTRLSKEVWPFYYMIIFCLIPTCQRLQTGLWDHYSRWRM